MDEVREYANKRMAETGICMVPSHYPKFKSKEHVDQWLAMSRYAFEHWEEEEDLWEFTTIKKEQYQTLLTQLKRNKERVPLEELRGRYQKPYRKLLEQLKVMTEKLLQDIVFHDLRIKRIHAEALYIQINEAIRESNLLEEIGNAVYQDQNLEAVLDKAKLLREMVHRIVNNFEKREKKENDVEAICR